MNFNAQCFLDAFLNETKNGGQKLFDIYKHNAEYTTEITNIINRIIDNAGYTHQNEYFRIDAVGWVSHSEDIKEEAKKVGIKPHLWDLKIAVEHENNKSDWSDEVIKLIHVKCPLKVIIAYNYSDERGEKERDKLTFMADQMKKINAFYVGKEKEQYLIILGNGCNHQTGEPDYKDFGYIGYLYNWGTGKFELLSPSED